MTMTTSETREVLAAKLHPRRFTAMSSKMAAIVGFLIDYEYTEPAITELVIDSTGVVLAGRTDDRLMNDIIGSVEDLDRNLRTLIRVAGLTPAEARAVRKARKARVRDLRRAR